MTPAMVVIVTAGGNPAQAMLREGDLGDLRKKLTGFKWSRRS